MKQHRTTRVYDSSRGVRLASGATTSAATALPTFGPLETREVRIRATADAHLRFGDSSVAASVAGTSIPLVAGVEVQEVPASATHFAVIRDSADGFVTLTPVA